MKQPLKKVFVYIIIVAGAFALCTCGHREKQERGLVQKEGILYMNGSNKPYTGLEKAKVNNKLIEYEVVDGKKNGIFKISYLNGNPQMIGQMRNNKNEGLWKYFYMDSTLESQGLFKDDFPDGEWRWYYPDGRIKEKGSYLKGISQGIWTEYDPRGNIVSKTLYKDGKKIKTKNIKKQKNKVAAGS